MQNSKKKVDNICILRTSSLGDICHMLPFIYTLKKEYPKAKITWIIGKTEASFLNKIDGIDFNGIFIDVVIKVAQQFFGFLIFIKCTIN